MTISLSVLCYILSLYVYNDTHVYHVWRTLFECRNWKQIVMNSRFLKQKLSRRPRDQDLKRDYESSYSLLANCDESDVDDLPLQPKRSMQRYLEHSLQSGETLLSLALRFNCSVAQIKQANNILRENEIFALRTVRIPVTPFSLIRDGVAGIHSCNRSSSDQRIQTDSSGNCSSTESSPLSSLHIASNSSISDPLWNNVTMQNEEGLCNPLLTPVPQPLVVLDSEPQDLDLNEIQNDQNKPSGIFHCSGADGGLSWFFLVVCSLVLGFGGPLIIYFLLYEHEKVVHSESLVPVDTRG